MLPQQVFFQGIQRMLPDVVGNWLLAMPFIVFPHKGKGWKCFTLRFRGENIILVIKIYLVDRAFVMNRNFG